jgi:hypothetical protein
MGKDWQSSQTVAPAELEQGALCTTMMMDKPVIALSENAPMLMEKRFVHVVAHLPIN